MKTLQNILPAEPKNIIIRLPNWVGDLVMATPILSDVRKKFPNAFITAMCKSPLCTLLEKDKSIDELFCFVKPSNEFIRRRDLSNIVEKIKKGNYDLGILLTNSFSSAWWFFLGNVKARLGYKAYFRTPLLNLGMPFPKDKDKQHLVVTYKMLLQPLGIEVSDTAPRLFLSDEETKAEQTLLLQRGYKKGKILIGINAFSSYGPAKCWPKENFQKLTKMLLEKEDVFVLFFGDSSVTPLAKEICYNLPDRAINLVGATNLRELAALIKQCNLLITNDSGPMHIAAALSVPLLAIFGSSCETVTGPYNYGSENIINKRLSCAPCFKRKCADYLCLRSITPEEVFSKAKELLQW